MNLGSTRVSAPMVNRVARSVLVPDRWNRTICVRREATRIAAPITPFATIMNEAKTVSRATDRESWLWLTIIEMMSDASMTVTARARTMAPKGWPTRWAITSALATAARTDTIRPTTGTTTKA